ncbi:MAG: fibronectin type III domain-containing protein [Bacteroidales bacterium]|nr:fibronectin type III domain-containing protein [Bacteroidales bacterium]
MKKLYVLILVLMVSAGLGLVPSKAQAQTIWDGTADASWYDASITDFYLYTPEELAGLAQLVNAGNDFNGKTIYLESDIWLNADGSTTNNWTMIGGSQTETTKEHYANFFRGTFHGNGHYIYNMYCSRDNGNGGFYYHAGLFGDLKTPCLIDSLVIVNPITRATGGFQGGLAACIAPGGNVTISKILVINANINQNHSGVDGHNGALIGGVYPNEGATTYITNCGATGSVYGAYSGGLTGGGGGGIYTNCYFNGTTSGGSYGCGGIASHGGSLVNCYSPNLGGSGATNGISINNVSLTNPSATLGDAFRADCLLPINGGYPLLEFMICNDPTCGPVTGLTASNITGSSAQINWTPSHIGTPMDYTLEYMENGTGNWITIPGVTGTSYLLDNLNPSTLYQIRVMSNCDDGSSSDYTLGSFSTTCMCGPVSNIVVENVTGTSAQLSWTPNTIGTLTDYTVEYSEAGMENWTTITGVTTASYLLGGLDPSTAYDIRVIANCDNGFTGAPVSTSVLTRCLVSGAVAIGNGTGTAVQYPVNNYYRYSLTQQIFTAAEMGFNPQTFNGISFEYSYSSPSTDKNNVNIYLGHTTMSNFSANTDYVPFDSLQLVYSGNLNCQQGWNEFSFNAPFNYNGTDNLVVVVDDNSDDYNGSSYTFYTHSTDGVNMCHALFSDSNNPDLTNLSSFSGSNNLYSSRNNIKFHYCDEGSTCAAPSMMVTNVTDQSAEIVWVAGYQETAWELEYKMSADASWTPYGTVYSMDEILSNLASNTSYDVRMRSDCGSDYSPWVSASFTTECGPINTIPYYVDFETGVVQTSQDKYLTCWNRYTSNSSHYAYVGVGSSNAHAGNNYLDFHYTPSCNVIAIMPAIDATYPVSTLMADFWLKRTNNNSTMLEVGIMTDDDDYTTFVPIDTIDIPEIGTYREFMVPFTHYTGTGAYIAFRASNGNSAGFMLDDLTIDYAPACDAPAQITASNITNESVEITWQAGDQESSWELEYKADSETNWTSYGTVYTMDETITNLLANTNYSLRMRSECGNGEYSNWVMITFKTLCGPITQIPYVEDFNSYPTNSMPECWTVVTTNSSYLYVTSHNSSNCIRSAGNSIFASPAIAENIENLQVSFDFEREGSSSGTLDFGIMTDITNPNSFELIRHYDPAEDVVIHELIYLNDVVATGSGRFLAFRQNSTVTNWYYWVDNINVDYVPSCVPPTMTLGTVSVDEATLNWNDDQGSQTEWEFVYGAPGFDPDNAVATPVYGTPTYTLTGLSNNTQYEAYVRAVCGSDVSDWSNAVSFMTLPGLPASTPYFCDFEDADENGSWALINGSQTNKWYIGVPTGATDSVLFVSDNGTSSTYNTGSTSNVWAYRDIQFGAGAEFNLSFLWKCYGESSYDYIQVFIGNPSEVSAGSTTTPSGAVMLTNPRLNQSNNWQRFSTMFGSEYANTTKRLYFLWLNDGSSGSNPPAIIDSIQITVSECGRPSNLMATAITPTSIDVRFDPALSTDYAWEYVVCPANGNPDAATPVAIMDTFFTADNLNSNTTYNIYVRTVCDNGGYSAWSNMLSATTDCGPITQLPFTETFDTPNANNYVNCWSRYASDPSHYVYLYGDVTPPTGQYSLDFHWTPNCSVIAIMPAVDDNINVSDLMASFWIQRTGTTSVFEVGVMTNKDDHTTFEPLDTIPSPVVDQWHYIDVPLSQYTGTGKYIAFRVTQGTSCGFRMDDITLDYIPSCWTPSNFTASNITATSVDLSWTPVSSESEWIVEYKSDSDPDWNVMNSYTTSLTVSGLDSNTTYSFRVKANCGGGDESNYTSVITATTLPCSNGCVYVINMTDDYGDGWNGNTINIVVNGATVATATIGSGSSNSVTYYQCEAAEVSFSWTSGSYSGEASFTIEDADGNTLYTCSDGSTLANGAVIFSHTCGTITCPSPSALNATSTTLSSVTLAWTENGSATEWNIAYGNPGFNPTTGGTIVTANTNPFTVNNLSSDPYEFYVQANCDVTDQSAWFGPITVVPGSINMLVYGDQTVSACGGHIYDNGGVSDSYATGCNSTLTVNPDAPGMLVRLVGTYDTESFYDKLKIYDGASTSGTVLGEFSGTGSIDVISTTGPLTLAFLSDASNQGSGFDLLVSCEGGGPVADCDVPTNLAVSNITTTGATATWTAGGAETAWNVQYKQASATDWSNSINVTAPTYAFSGLTPNTQYFVRVQAACDATTTSDWTSAVSFTTAQESSDPCVAPSNLISTGTAAHSIDITWTENGTATSWAVYYRVNGASSWITETANATAYTITGLEPETEYTIQVVANCADGVTSEPSNTINVTTQPDGIEEYDAAAVSVFPNPTTGMVQVSSTKYQVSGVDVYDVYGKLLKTDAMMDNSTVDMSGYAAGVYFLRVSTENGVVTKRVVKK